jgi:ferric-dicitrate binding protein FerR (iron transport regulator)
VDQEQIHSLLQKFLDNNCSPAEINRLVEWWTELGQEEEQRQWIRQELAAGLAAAAFEETEVRSSEEWEQKVTAIFAAASSQARPRVETRRLIWVRYSVAAAAILAIGLIYLLYVRPVRPAASVIVTRSDLSAPASAHAVLTLGNGQQIALDSIQNGTLARQGQVRVVKLADGQVAYSGQDQEVFYNTLYNPRGSRVITLTLPDGSGVWLNAASSIRYPTSFTGAERRVDLTGEAYFEVSKNASKPFKVSIPGKEEIEVLGTSFNVNAYGDESEIKTTLLEGSVRVRTESLLGVNTNKTKPGVVLKHGQQAQQIVGGNPNNAGRLTIVRDADIEQAVAWKNGEFAFNRAKLSMILREVSRWYDLDIEGPAAPVQRTFSGVVSRSSNLSDVMKILESAGIRFRIEGKKMILLQ